MKVEIRVHPTASAHEFADVELHVPGRSQPHVLDVEFAEILKRAPVGTDEGARFPDDRRCRIWYR